MTGECTPCNDADKEPKESSEKGSLPKLKELELASLGWLVLFGIGGLILSLYYANIGYFPQIKWEESLVYLGVMAMAGFFLMLLFSLLLYSPGVIWCKHLLCEPSLEELFFYIPPKQKPDCKPQRQLCLRSTLLYIALPFSLHMIFLHTILNWSQLTEKSQSLLSSASLISTSIFFWLNLRNGILPKGEASEEMRQDLFRHAGFFFFSSALSTFSVWVINRLLVASPSYVKLAVACTITVVVVNVFVALTHATDRRTALGIAIVGAFALLIFGDLLIGKQDARFSMRLFSRYGIGVNNPATLIVTKEGCELLKSHIGDTRDCGNVASLKFEKVEILSRLGPEYFLSIDGRTLTLPQKEVSSWSTLDKTKMWLN